MAARGVILTYEAVRYWCRKFGQTYANALRRRRPRPGDKWHLDEVFLTINGHRHYLWRAVEDGHVLDILVQRRRDKTAAKKFFRKLLKGLTDVPRVIITDKLASYGRPSGKSCPASSIGNTAISIIARKTPTNPLANASGVWVDSSPQDMRSAFSPRMVPSHRTSAPGVTASQPERTAKR
jgi:hypothetical protein